MTDDGDDDGIVTVVVFSMRFRHSTALSNNEKSPNAVGPGNKLSLKIAVAAKGNICIVFALWGGMVFLAGWK